MRADTRGGILHWGRDDEGELGRFRAEIRHAFCGRAPRVFDPFAGGGAIPLEAMRLGCEAVAALNTEFDSLYLEEEANPRRVAKPAVAYLWN